MKQHQSNEITIFQYIFFIAGAQIGIGILSLPADLAKGCGTDGWIAIILGGAMSMIASLIIINIMEKHPNDTIFELLPRYFGKWLGKIMTVAFSLYAALAATTVTFTSIHLVQVWILPQTSNYFLMMLLMIPTFLAVRNGVRFLGRYAEIVFYMTLWMPILIAIPLKDGHFLHLLPVLKEGWGPIIKTVRTTILSFLGFELVFLIYPLLREKHLAKKGIVIANLISLTAFVFVTIICFIFYSPYEITHYLWPTLSLLKTIEFPFMERFEIVFLAAYLFVLSTTSFPYLFTAVFGISRMLNRQHHIGLLTVCIAIYIVVSLLYNPPFVDLKVFSQWWGKTGTIVAYIFPPCMLLYMKLYSLLKGRKST
ncbi:endospore germination permease [Anoxybacteroides tepidamans]|uniref:GerAB/ArcD/ProY family transporter n=1 Tax=Anoxybacteroides tepidamans TaxID=265948 RepID=UPI0004839745|nr:endospore germination permease [Anoxybacillus tepidamans]